MSLSGVCEDENFYSNKLIFSFQVDPKYVRNLKFTKHHNHVARKNLFKSRQVKLAAAGSSSKKVVNRGPPRQTEAKKSSWSLSSLLSNVTSYFTGETTTTETKKRPKRTHPTKKSTKSATNTVTTGKK